MDNLINCPRCSSDACYVEEVNQDIKTYLCYGCGYMSNSLMKEGETFLEEQVSILPELYKDLLFTDNEGKVWMPSTINVPDKGMVFANGTNTQNWKWAAVKAVPIKEEEKHKYPIPGKSGQFYKNRMDMSTMKEFDERDFMEALSYINILPE
jgi:hypothetical protein